MTLHERRAAPQSNESASRRGALARLGAALHGDRAAGPVAVVVAHPDDETIGVGGHLDALPDLLLVHVTDGAPEASAFWAPAGFGSTEAYADARRAEFAAAMEMAGVGASRRRRLGLVDQGVTRALGALVDALARLYEEAAPQIVLTHPYEGGHPDHDATACAARIASEVLDASGKPSPSVYEMAFYHRRDGKTCHGEFLPCLDAPELNLSLDAAARERKTRMLECFRTQRDVLAPFPRDRERFREMPDYRFDRRPHEGPLNYETWGWPPMAGELARLARETRASRGLPGVRVRC